MTQKEQREVFSKNLKKLLEEKGIQQTTLADELDLGKTTINNWVCGLSMPSYAKIRKIADFLNVPVSYLTEDSNSLRKGHDVEVIMESLFKDSAKGSFLIELRNISEEMSELELAKLVRYAKFMLEERDQE